MLSSFPFRSGSKGPNPVTTESDDYTTVAMNPMDHSVPLTSDFGYDLTRDAEEITIRNYFATFAPEQFHKAAISAMTILVEPDGRKILITGAEDGTVKMWFALQGKFIADLPGHLPKTPVKSIVVHIPQDSPGGGGGSKVVNPPIIRDMTKSREINTENYFIITVGSDKDVHVIDYTRREIIHSIRRNDPLTCLAICDKTNTFVFAGNDKKIGVYGINDHKTFVGLADFQTEHTDLILGLVIVSSDTREKMGIVSVGWDKKMFIWDYHGNKKRFFEKGHTKSITTIVVHYPSGEEKRQKTLADDQVDDSSPILITGSLDKTAIIWDYETGKKVRTLEGHTGQINAIRVSDRDDDGSPPIVITASVDKTLNLWDLLTGLRIRTIEFHEPLNTLTLLDSNEGIIIFSSGKTPSLLMWDLRRTQRTRKFETAAVTAIDVYTPHTGHPQVLIGCVDCSFSIFDFVTGQSLKSNIKNHGKRINAGVIFPPGPFNPSTPVVVSVDGQAVVQVWDLDVQNPKVNRTLTGHQIVVLTVALYDPFLYGRTTKTSVQRTRRGGKINLHIPCAITGGADKTIKFWNFLGIGSDVEFYTIPHAHTANVRSIVIYHPIDPDSPVKFISGSYDLTTILWDLETATKLWTYQDFHTDYVFFTAIYDPAWQFPPVIEPDENKTEAAVITTSYDGKIGIWNMESGNLRLKIENAHKDSITALAVYTPPFYSTEAPILITGSIDKLVVLWNLFTGEKIQTLVGHSDRVCWIKIYDPPGKHPMILSGGDDNQTILWEDSLYQKPFMPLRESVIKAFEADLDTTDWPMITEMARAYKSLLFIENSNLFMIAVAKERPDFLLKFWDYLTLTLPTIKSTSFELKDGSKRDCDILSQAIYRCDLVSVRAIIYAWIKNLNSDMDNMLTQREYHPSYFLNDETLALLCKFYPSEFLYFITNLRLVRNYSGLMEGKQRKYLNSGQRYEFRGSDSRVEMYKNFWANFDPLQSYLVMNKTATARKAGIVDSLLGKVDRLLMRILGYFTEFFDEKIEAQPVTSMMVPFKNCNEVFKYLKMFVEVSNQLDNVSIFDCEIGVVFLRYFWHIRGRGAHVLAFLKYLIFQAIFLVCIYSYEPHYRSHPGIIVLSVIAIFGFVWYGYEEFSQMIRMSRDQYRVTGHRSSISVLFLKHVADLWNAVDFIIVMTGIIGLMLRLGFGVDTPTGRSFLATTSVFMWFKLLYFLRPFSTSGPLVAMIVQIAGEIRTFILVLFCVLAGFAQAFWLLCNNDKGILFGTVSNSFLTSFLYMLGQNVVADFSGSSSPDVATVFLVVFMMVMMILMLNLLIALMGDVFSKVRSEGVALWRKEQAAIIVEESFLYEDDKHIPKQLYILKYTSEVDNKELDYKTLVDELCKTSDVPPFTRFFVDESNSNQTMKAQEDEDSNDIKDLFFSPNTKGQNRFSTMNLKLL